MSKGKWKSSWYISHHISISPQFHINWQIFRKVICIWWCMVNPIMTWAAPSAAAPWFQVVKTRQQINSPDLISGIFLKHLSVYLQYLRFRCHCIFIFEICQTVANHKYDQSISRFLEIWCLAGFCHLAQLCAPAWRNWQRCCPWPLSNRRDEFCP